jgi:outer membrane immunogenic protein
VCKCLLMMAALFALGSSAFAADLPNVKGALIFTPPAFSWTGLYIGVQAGYQWGATNFDSNAATIQGQSFIGGLPGYDASGVVGGAHLGYNWQVDEWVIGVEGDIEGSSYSGSGSGTGSAGGPGLPPVPISSPGFSSYRTNIPIEGSARLRIGYAWDRVLFYATGGGTLADVQTAYTAPAGSDSFAAGRLGWTLGAGIEYAIDPNWSIRAEYRYTDFGDFNDYLVGTYPAYFARLHVIDDAVRVGFSYKFDLAPPPIPVVAKY